MKHRALINSITDAVAAEMRPLLAPFLASELARQRAGGDPSSSPTLPMLARAADRARIVTYVEWNASTRLTLTTLILEASADAIHSHIARLMCDVCIAEKIADGTAQREFDAYVAEAARIPVEQAAARARLEKLKDFDAGVMAADARRALTQLVASMRTKREARERRGRAA
jgi:hypothetical protein